MNEKPTELEQNSNKSFENLSFTVAESLIAALMVILGSQIVGGLVSFPGFIVPDLQHITLPLGWLVGALSAIAFILLWKKIHWSIIPEMLKQKWNPLYLVLSIVLFFVTLPMVEYATMLIPTKGLGGLLDMIYEMFEAAFTMMFSYKIAAAITICIFAPVFEEIIFRGLILKGMLNRNVNPWIAIIVSSALFGLVHLNPWQFVGAMLLGSCFGFVYYRTKNIWYVILLHAINNTISTVYFFMNGESMDMEEMSVYDFDPIYLVASIILTGLVGLFIHKKTQINFE